MQRVLRVLKYVVLAVLLVAAGAVTYLYARKPAMEPAPRISIEPTPQRLARGQYLYRLADCDGCHSERDFSHFGGPVVPGRRGVGGPFPKEMGLPGQVVAPNITPDRETGIGEWTDGEKVRAIREGVDRDGRTLFPLMPYAAFRSMSDEDVYSLVAYLNSLPAVKHSLPQTRLDFPVSLLVKSAPQPAGRVPHPNLNDQVRRGRYLVTVAGCADCHAATFSGGQRFQVAPGVAVVSANISPDLHTGIGRWSEQDFVNRFAQYRDYVEHGSPLSGAENFTLMPWLNLCQLPDDDLRAVYGFLHAQKPVYKAVETHPGFDPVPAPKAISKR